MRFWQPPGDALLQILLVIPFLLLARRGSGSFRARYLLMAAVVFLATSVVTDLLAGISFFRGQEWNWAGKLAALGLALAFVAALRPLTHADFGVTPRIERAGGGPVLCLGGAWLLLRFGAWYLVTRGADEWHPEAVLFQATLPGLAEELIFRGLLLTLFNLAFPDRRWKVAGVRFGWGAVLTSLLFGAAHGLGFHDGLSVQFNAFAFGRTLADGFLFALLAEQTKSLVPGIVLHNLLNLIGNH